MYTPKFRIWDKKYKHMYYKTLIGNLDPNDEKNWTAHAIWVEPEFVDYKCEPHWCNIDHTKNFNIMSSIGLIAKDNKDIYDGDIVKDQYGNLYLVFHHHIGFEFLNDSGENLYYDVILEEEYYEVLGNKWENPELICIIEESIGE